MIAPFTLAAFDALCAAIAPYPVFSVADYLMTARSALPAHYAILRFDVDYREPHSELLAQVAHRHGLRGSFYFRHRKGTFPLAIMRRVAALGHEIGYHYETLDTCRGDQAAAEAQLLAHIADLRTAGFAIRTIAAHGAAPTAPTYHSNLDLIARAPDLLQRAQLLGETTFSVDFTQVAYLSDAGWTWRLHTDYAPGSVGTIMRLARALARFPDDIPRLYITVHPQQWFASAWTAHTLRQRNRAGKWLRRNMARITR